MASTVADVMVATLKASGVQRVYGIPGDSLNGFTGRTAPGRRNHLGTRTARGGRRVRRGRRGGADR
jgi:thiamine pyrophosphate-dependent acetolactate synthase large subunit-like protein